MALTLDFESQPRRKSGLKAYYGFTKLTKKIMRKHELVIWFENCNHNPARMEQFINRRMHIVHTRTQTQGEMSDAYHSNREWTKYGYKIDEDFESNIELVLEKVFLGDSKNVSLEERNVIREKLRLAYAEVYDPKDLEQTSIIFD